MSRTGSGLRRGRRLKNEINVVPYIDVMLVLLIIFMVTAPMLQQGVEVKLPVASSEPIPTEQPTEPLIVTVARDGAWYLNVLGAAPQPLEVIQARVAATLQLAPTTQVYVRGDRDARYESIALAMAALQRAGVPNVGLITEPAPGATP